VDNIDRFINNLPIEKIGNDRKSCVAVYQLTRSLDSELIIALKASGYHNKLSVTLECGTNVNSVWVRT